MLFQQLFELSVEEEVVLCADLLSFVEDPFDALPEVPRCLGCDRLAGLLPLPGSLNAVGV